MTQCTLPLFFVLVASPRPMQAQEPDSAQRPRLVPLRPLTRDVEVLHGDPEAAGSVFVMRIRELPGTRIPPHSHPVDEHLTVVQGTLHFALGERFDSTALRELRTGSYAFLPKGTTMFGYTPGPAIVQVHGVGPFHIRWRDGMVTLEDSAAGAFRFRRGERVVTPRGQGRIRQGYASGSLVQYEIEDGRGRLFMALEAELQRR